MLNGDPASAAITAVLGLVSGAVLAYVTAVVKFRKDLEAEFDKDLRERRLGAYEKLWATLESLARYDLPEPLTPYVLSKVTEAMRQWYFQSGGLYLSDDTRKVYFTLKDAIQRVVNNSALERDAEIPGWAQKPVIDAASLLRACLARDVRTRRAPPVPDA